MKTRYNYRLRPGRTALRYLAREWGMCRYVWNELTAQSRAIYELGPSIGLAGAEKETFGAAGADKFLTKLRATTIDEHGTRWLSQGSSVVQQQTVRDFATSRTKALLDIMEKIPVRQRAGLPNFRRKEGSLPTLNYSTRGFSLKPDPESGVLRLALPGGIRIPVAWSRDLPAAPSSVRVSQDSLGHWYASFVVEAPDTTYAPPRTATRWASTGASPRPRPPPASTGVPRTSTSSPPTTYRTRNTARRQPRSSPSLNARWPAGANPAGKPKLTATGRPGFGPPAPTRRLPGSVKTTPANGPEPWCPTTSTSPSKISNQSSWPRALWQRSPRTPPSGRPKPS